MNESEDAQWSAPQHYDHMNAQVSDNDFTNFLNLTDLSDIEFPVFDNGSSSREPSQQLNELPDGIHIHHTDAPSYHPTQALAANAHQQHPPQFRSTQNQAGSQDHSNAFFDLSMPMYAATQHQYSFQGEQPRFVPHSAIPPTPNSLEIHAGAHFARQQQMGQQQHMDPQNQAIYQLRKDDAASFTPLVSPAVTPRESAFRVPQDFTVPPGAYFSPLSSPALVAQRNRQMDHHTPGNSGSSTATSPADVDVDMLEPAMQDSGRKTKTSSTSKRNLSRSTTAMSKIKQSPIHRARRKSRPSQAMTPKEVAMLKEAALSTASRPNSFASGLDVPRSSDSEASISPEPLTEASMGPPPRPGSVSQSPALLAQRSGLQAVQNKGVAPATPASLMRLQNSPDGVSPSMQANGQRMHMGVPAPILEDLILPEAAEADALTPQDDIATPRVVPRKTPKLNPLMTPSSGAAFSGRPSPALSAITSPTTPIAQSPANGRRVDPKGRNNKKRSSVSGALPSPALRPKISPSIKPLLPDSVGMTDDAHTLLLATKSNYQNLLEGTHVPGVTYPEALSTNLTSKRTSHKIAEQGRRNRINTALQEMQALLASPTNPASASKTPKVESKSPEGDPTSPEKPASAAAQANSKAATVEMAIDYIKTLQREKTEQEQKMRDKDRELDELRKKMDEMESRLRATSETSSQAGA